MQDDGLQPHSPDSLRREEEAWGGVLIPTTALALFCICTIKASLICFHLKGGKLAKNTV